MKGGVEGGGGDGAAGWARGLVRRGGGGARSRGGERGCLGSGRTVEWAGRWCKWWMRSCEGVGRTTRVPTAARCGRRTLAVRVSMNTQSVSNGSYSNRVLTTSLGGFRMCHFTPSANLKT